MSRDADPKTQFVMRMAKEAPTLKAMEIDELMRLSRAHGRIQVRRCNGNPSNREEKREDTIEARISAILEPTPVSVHEFGGDPRGYTVKLKLPSGAYNNLGGEAWGIPQ